MTIAEICNELITDFVALIEKCPWLPVGKYVIGTMIAANQEISDITFHDHEGLQFQIEINTIPYVVAGEEISVKECPRRKICVTQRFDTRHEHTEVFKQMAPAFVHFANTFVTNAVNDYFEEKTIASLAPKYSEEFLDRVGADALT